MGYIKRVNKQTNKFKSIYNCKRARLPVKEMKGEGGGRDGGRTSTKVKSRGSRCACGLGDRHSQSDMMRDGAQLNGIRIGGDGVVVFSDPDGSKNIKICTSPSSSVYSYSTGTALNRFARRSLYWGHTMKNVWENAAGS